MVPKCVLKSLFLAALLLPAALLVLAGVERLLLALGDAAGAAFFERVVLAGVTIWVLALLGLLLATAATLVGERKNGE